MKSWDKTHYKHVEEERFEERNVFASHNYKDSGLFMQTAQLSILQISEVRLKKMAKYAEKTI